MMLDVGHRETNLGSSSARIGFPGKLMRRE